MAETVAKQSKAGQYRSSKKVYSSSSRGKKQGDEEPTEESELGYSSRTQEAEDAINYAIDKVMEYNDREEVNHKDKFRVGIGCIRKLTGRGDQVIRRVIEGRQEELGEHHQKHQLGSTHNSKGKDALSIQDIISL